MRSDARGVAEAIALEPRLSALLTASTLMVTAAVAAAVVVSP